MMNNKRINVLAEGEWVLPKGTKYRNFSEYEQHDNDDFKSSGNIFTFLIDSKLFNQSGNHTEVDFSGVDLAEAPPLYPHKGIHVPKEGIEFRFIYGKLLLVGNFGIALSRGSEHVIYDWCFVSGNTDELELKRNLPKTINVCSDCFKEACECATQPSTEPWTDRLQIMNWCHQQQEVVLVDTVPEGISDLWSQYCFDEDRLHEYRWNKINPETNELMYSESKVFCDKECL